MKYMGSKNRIAKHLLPIMLENRNDRTWVEPFVGGANMIDKVDGKRIGADFNEYLICMWKELQNGWTPPDYVDEETFKSVRKFMDEKHTKHFISFVRFGCSFGAEWSRGGFARNVAKDKPNADILNRTTKSYCGQSKRNILKQLPKVQDVDFVHSSYQDLEIPPNSLIYCDPPYEGTTKYNNDFNHVDFWEWCRTKAKEGHLIYVSEYNAPSDFKCVWEGEIRNGLNVANSKQVKKVNTEKLFVYCG
tara:strand:- start:43 stop:783 length:741 start_codon:yes stop_codon:yes gene_type:complete